MKKRIMSGILLLAMLLAFCSNAFAGSLSAFSADRVYVPGSFADVDDSNDWFASSVASAYRLGLVRGVGGGLFSPLSNVTVADAITMAARIHKSYNTGNGDFEQGTPWYKVYVDYAIKNKIIGNGFVDYNRDATRAEYAKILANALPDEALAPINQIEDNAIPDVPSSRSYAPGVYKLYRAGVLTGSNGGYYHPDETIWRSEMSTLVARMVDESSRKEFDLVAKTEGYDAKQIGTMCSSGVFFIEIFDEYGYSMKTGSGFFISKTGMAVTNFHVVSGGASAIITTVDGSTYDVSKYYDVDIYNDLALIQIEGVGFNALELGNSDEVIAGESIFAIGSPYGLDNTLTTGVVSNIKRTLDGVTYIQHSAPISPGSSGGPVIDDKGKVIGVTTAFINEQDAQNLNLAVPSNLIANLSRTEPKTFDFTDFGDYWDYEPEMPLNPEIIANPDNIQIRVGETIAVNIYASEESGLSYKAHWENFNENVATCFWDEDWTDSNHINLNITGHKAGETKIYVTLIDANAEEITWAETLITVKVV